MTGSLREDLYTRRAPSETSPREFANGILTIALTRLNARRLRRRDATQRHNLPACLPPCNNSRVPTLATPNRALAPKANQPRPRRKLPAPCLGTVEPPRRFAPASLPPGSGPILGYSLRRCVGAVGHHRPRAPLALRIPLAPPGHPQRLRAPGPGAQTAQGAPAGMARPAQRVELAPDSGATDLGALGDPYATGHLQRRQPGTPRHSGKAASRRPPHPLGAHLRADARQRPPDHHAVRVPPPAFQPWRRLGSPIDGDRPPAPEERARPEVLVACARPIQSQAHRARRGQLAQGLEEPGSGPVPGRQALVVAQARQTCRRRCRGAKGARQVGLTAPVLGHQRSDNVSQGSALMPMCPGQHRRDRVVETSSPRGLRAPPPRLA
jgi:hypothetical protein